MVAIGFSRSSVTKKNILSKGSFQKIILVPSNECKGVISDDFVVVNFAVVKKDKLCFPLGWGCALGGTMPAFKQVKPK